MGLEFLKSTLYFKMPFKDFCKCFESYEFFKIKSFFYLHFKKMLRTYCFLNVLSFFLNGINFLIYTLKNVKKPRFEHSDELAMSHLLGFHKIHIIF